MLGFNTTTAPLILPTLTSCTQDRHRLLAVIGNSLINMDTRVVPIIVIRIERYIQHGGEVEHGYQVCGIHSAVINKTLS